MKLVRLIHWKEEEVADRIEWLRAAGFAVDAAPFYGASLRRLREAPPDAIVIDLTRLPSPGGDLGVNLRKTRATRHLPLVFVAGAP
jgi:DNA-binding response OmpR family regulator